MDLVRKKHLNTMEGSQFYISLKITVKNYFYTNMVYKMIFFFQMTYYITIIMVYFRHATFQCTGRPCCSMAVVGRSRATSPKTASLPCGKGKIPDKNEKYLSGHVKCLIGYVSLTPLGLCTVCIGLHAVSVPPPINFL